MLKECCDYVVLADFVVFLQSEDFFLLHSFVFGVLYLHFID